MVTAKTQYNLKNAREYFEEHLCVGDYYDEGQHVAGEWIGVGAERLGLSGKVRGDDFLRLCENQHPSSGETLTQRLNTTRIKGGENAANRRIFYDFTFSPPKSVSLAGFLGKDERILEAHARAVKLALQEFEAFTATRVRTGGAQSDRLTGRMRPWESIKSGVRCFDVSLFRPNGSVLPSGGMLRGSPVERLPEGRLR